MSFRFPLWALIVIVTATAIGLVVRNQVIQQGEILQLKKQFDDVEAAFRLRSRIIAFLNHLDLESEADRELARSSRRLTSATQIYTPKGYVRGSFAPFRLGSGDARLIDVDGQPDGLEILSMATTMHMMPGIETSINVLFDKQQLVGIVSRQKNARVEMFDTVFQDENGDGIKDLVFREITINLKAAKTEQGKKLVYLVGPDGFVDPTGNLSEPDQ